MTVRTSSLSKNNQPTLKLAVTCILICFGGTFGEIQSISKHGVARQACVQASIFDCMNPALFRAVKQKVLVDLSYQTLFQLLPTCRKHIPPDS